MDAIQVKQAIRKDIPCGPGHHDLSKVRLTLSEKYWLGSRIAINRSTAAKLSKRSSLKFAKPFRDGSILNSKGGWPSTFDDISCKSIRDVYMQELELDTPDFLKLVIKETELTASKREKSISSQHPVGKLSFARRSV